MPKRKPKSNSVPHSPVEVISPGDVDIALIDSLANKGASVRVEETVPTLDSSLEEKQRWTAEQISSLGRRYEKFKDNVFKLCKNDEYRNWLQTTTQKELAENWGVSQSYISKTFGSLQKDLKEEVRENIIALLDRGESIRSVAEITGESKSKVQRIATLNNDDVSQNIPDDKVGQRDLSREDKRRQYASKEKEELINLLIQRDEIIGRLKKKLKDFT